MDEMPKDWENTPASHKVRGAIVVNGNFISAYDKSGFSNEPSASSTNVSTNWVNTSLLYAQYSAVNWEGTPIIAGDIGKFSFLNLSDGSAYREEDVSSAHFYALTIGTELGGDVDYLIVGADSGFIEVYSFGSSSISEDFTAQHFSNDVRCVTAFDLDYWNDGYSFFAFAGSKDNTVRKINSNAGVEWTHNHHSNSVEGIAGEKSSSTIWSAGEDGMIYSVSASDGSKNWEYSWSGESFQDLDREDGILYGVTSSGKIVTVDEVTGSEYARYNLNALTGTCVVAEGRNVYVGTSSGKVIRYDYSPKLVPTIDSTNSPVKNGEDLNVNITVVNEGGPMGSSSTVTLNKGLLVTTN